MFSCGYPWRLARILFEILSLNKVGTTFTGAHVKAEPAEFAEPVEPAEAVEPAELAERGIHGEEV